MSRRRSDIRLAVPHDESGFPRWRVVTGAIQQTRADLLSVAGVFVTAVALALANEAFPDAVRSTLPHRVLHGLSVVISTLALLTLGDLLRRLTHYEHRNRRSWMITIDDHARLLGFAIDSRPPGHSPYPVLFVIRTPTGRYVRPVAEPPDPAAASFYPSGTWAHVVEPDYEHGVYEVRVYNGTSMCELARASLEA